MVKIKMIKWIEKDPEGKEVETSTVKLIDVIMSIGLQKEELRGFANSRKIQRIIKTLNEAKEEIEFSFAEDLKLIQDFIEKYVPAQWGSVEKAMEALEEIMKEKV